MSKSYEQMRNSKEKLRVSDENSQTQHPNKNSKEQMQNEKLWNSESGFHFLAATLQCKVCTLCAES